MCARPSNPKPQPFGGHARRAHSTVDGAEECEGREMRSRMMADVLLEHGDAALARADVGEPAAEFGSTGACSHFLANALDRLRR